MSSRDPTEQDSCFGEVLGDWDKAHPKLMPAVQALAIAHLVLDERIRVSKEDQELNGAWATLDALVAEF